VRRFDFDAVELLEGLIARDNHPFAGLQALYDFNVPGITAA
jgi:hypothetical protein